MKAVSPCEAVVSSRRSPLKGARQGTELSKVKEPQAEGKVGEQGL